MYNLTDPQVLNPLGTGFPLNFVVDYSQIPYLPETFPAARL